MSGAPNIGKRGVRLGFLMVATTLAVAAAGYVFIEGWSIGDALYMAIITATTTGFAEVRPLSPIGRIWTVAVIILGIGSIAYAGGTLVGVIVERYLHTRRGRMRRIGRLRNHIIVCGFGRMGQHVCDDLVAARKHIVVIESSEAMREALDAKGYPFIIGDAGSDPVLREAGIDHAAGLVSVVSTDADNVFITLTAKALRRDLTVVSRALSDESEPKLRHAGADRVIKPYEVVGRRIAQLVIRPSMVEFVDQIVRDSGREITLEEVPVRAQSRIAGKSLAEGAIRKEWNIIVVAIRSADGALHYNPGSNTTITPGDTLIVIGDRSLLDSFTQLCRGPGEM